MFVGHFRAKTAREADEVVKAFHYAEGHADVRLAMLHLDPNGERWRLFEPGAVVAITSCAAGCLRVVEVPPLPGSQSASFVHPVER